MKRLYMMIVLILSSALCMWGQDRISGRVTDTDKLPVIGAGVMIDGTTVGTVTDMDGRWELNAAKGAKVTVSCMGYASYTFTVGDAAVYDVVLDADSNFLDEVVVVGYDTQKKVNLTG